MAAVEVEQDVQTKLRQDRAAVILAKPVVEIDRTTMSLIQVQREDVARKRFRTEAQLPDAVRSALIRCRAARIGERIVELRLNPVRAAHGELELDPLRGREVLVGQCRVHGRLTAGGNCHLLKLDLILDVLVERGDVERREIGDLLTEPHFVLGRPLRLQAPSVRCRNPETAFDVAGHRSHAAVAVVQPALLDELAVLGMEHGAVGHRE